MDLRLYRDFARLEDEHWWFQGRKAVLRQLLRRTLSGPEPRSILDVGSGTGGVFPLLSEFGQVEGLELSEEGRALCRARFPDITVHAGGLPDGIPPDRRFELVTALDMLEHLEEPVAALRAIRAALLPNGRLICTVPAFEFLWNEHDELNHHHRRYTRVSLVEHLSAAGFEATYCSYYNAALFVPMAAVRLVQRLVRGNPRGRVFATGPRSDLRRTFAPANRVLAAIFAAERFVVPRLRLPFGASLIAVAKPR